MIVYGIMLSGTQGSGKTTTSDMLKEWAQKNDVRFYGVKFACTLYEMHDAVRDIAVKKGIDMPKKDGKLLQLLGTEWGRTNYGENVWVDATKKTVENITNEELLVEETFKRHTNNPYKKGLKIMVVIDDCRFPNELDAFKGEFLTVRLTADRDSRKARADGWRDTENHPSETALDGMEDQFDLVLDTVALSKDKVTSVILDMAVLKGKRV
jgi:hypothetical protein